MLRNQSRWGFRVLLVQSVMISIFLGCQATLDAQEITPDIFKQLKFRHIGPRGNRVSAVYGVPGDPRIYYAGSAAGGIFKTTDGGINWTPIFDNQKFLAIGALAVARSDANIIWAGTGETWFRNENKYLPIGNGVYKSTDAGKSWTHAGLDKTGRIGRIVIDPRKPDIVFVAAMGHCDGPQQERGVFRTTDGGKNWKRVLFADENTGCADIAIDPNNPRILLAGMWQVKGVASGGPGSGLFISRDRGETWKRLSGHGLPEPPVGKIGIAIAPSNSLRIYALIETGGGLPWRGKKTSSGVLWRSDDGGENWELVSYNLDMAGRAAYYTRCAVAPDDDDEVYFIAARLTVSVNGGKSLTTIGRELHGDHHDIWIDPTNAERIIESNDGGVGISVNRGKTWRQIELPIAQMYSVAVDNQVPYYVYGNLQDWYSQRGPSNSRLARGGITRGMWHAVGGAEAGKTTPDPVDHTIIWSSGQYSGALDRYNLRTGQTRAVDVWSDNISGMADVDLKYRFYRTAPIIISPHDHNKVYQGSQFVHVTTNGGHSWSIISPDLTTNDKSRQQHMDSLTPLDYGDEDCAIFALAESPLEEGVIWAGTNDGLVQVTRDGGAQWTNVTANIPDLPPWGTVRNLEPSRYDPGTCYMTVDFHEENNRNPYVYKTTDYGKTWTSIISGIPKSLLSYTRYIKEDPVRRGLLYLGTENALYVSFDDGASWLSLQTNLPHAPVHGLMVQEHFNDLVVGTHGRGFWILDDLTPLQQLTPQVLESDAHLFAPRPAYRFHSVQPPEMIQGDPCVGENPPYGASINYYLKTEATGPVRIKIINQKGQTIRTLNGTKDRGINRVWWDLRHELSKEPRLRTSPPYAPWVTVGPEGWRPYVSSGAGGGRVALLAAPVDYTVRLSVGDKEFTQKLNVLKDPHSEGTMEDILAQTKLLREIQGDIESSVQIINQSEWMRKQIDDLKALLMEMKGDESIIAAGKSLDQKIISVEENLFNMNVTGTGQDYWYYRGPSKIMDKLLGLFRSVSSADFPPTTQHIERHEELKEWLGNVQIQFDDVLKNDLAVFNNLLKENDLPHLITVKTP